MGEVMGLQHGSTRNKGYDKMECMWSFRLTQAEDFKARALADSMGCKSFNDFCRQLVLNAIKDVSGPANTK